MLNGSRATGTALLRLLFPAAFFPPTRFYGCRKNGALKRIVSPVPPVTALLILQVPERRRRRGNAVTSGTAHSRIPVGGICLVSRLVFRTQ